MGLQSLLVQIQGLSGSEADLDTLNTLLRQAESTLRQSAASLLDAVQSLDFEAHSLGCLYLLEAKGRAANANRGDPEFLDAASRFLQACAAGQVQRAPLKLAALSRQLKEHALALGPSRGILGLRAAVAKLCPVPGLLSPAHADLFQLCLLAKCYSAAAPVIDVDVTSVDPAKTACTATDVLLYCYYGGMIAAGRRRYGRALDLFFIALTAPTLVVNAITVAVLKKYTLVALLHLGEVPPLPKHTSPAVTRSQKADAAPYFELAKLARGDKAQELAAFAAAKAEVWRADGNAGLVAKVVEHAGLRQVAALTQTFVTLPLGGVADAARLPGSRAAEDAVLGMVEDGEVHARISQRDGMVRFLDEVEEASSGDTASKLHDLVRQAMALAAEMAEVDHAVTCDHAYISKAAVRGGGGGVGTGAIPSGSVSGSGARAEPGDVAMADVDPKT